MSMKNIYRIIDANINRAAEASRVLEDTARFTFNEKNISEKLKIMRRNIRVFTSGIEKNCLEARDSQNDIGLEISKNLKIDNKSSLTESISANFKRLQEALRSIEENLKLVSFYEISKKFECLRFDSYTFEKEYFTNINILNKKEKMKTDLYCITAEQYSNGRKNIDVVKSLINAEIKIIQYREKDKTKLVKFRECLEIRKLTADAGVTFIVNDDVDIGLAVSACGVHIGQDDIPIEKVRELTGENMIIGLSTHSPTQAEDAVKRGADYIGVGPIYKTFTKKDVCDPVGLTYLEYAVQNINIPFVAIGGIKEHNISEVANRGAKCISLVTEIVGASDIEGKIRSIRNKLKGE